MKRGEEKHRSILQLISLVSTMPSQPLVYHHNNIMIICIILFSLTEPGILDKVLLNTPEQLVKFKAYIRDEKDDEADMVDRRLTRIKNQNRLPLGVWAKMVTESIHDE